MCVARFKNSRFPPIELKHRVHLQFADSINGTFFRGGLELILKNQTQRIGSERGERQNRLKRDRETEWERGKIEGARKKEDAPKYIEHLAPRRPIDSPKHFAPRVGQTLYFFMISIFPYLLYPSLSFFLSLSLYIFLSLSQLSIISGQLYFCRKIVRRPESKTNGRGIIRKKS